MTDPAARLPSFSRVTARRLVATARQLGARRELWGPHRAFSPDERHAVRVAATATWEAGLLGWLPSQTTGLHVYAPALVSMRRFVLDDDGRAVIVSRERAGVDW